MNFTESIQIALEAIWHNKMRSLLTMLGIIIGIAAVIAVVAIGQGGRSVLMNEMEKIGSNLFVVWTMNNDDNADVKLTYEDAKAAAKAIPEIKYIAPSSYSNVEVNIDKGKKYATLQGVTANYSIVRNVELEQGRFLNEADVNAARKVVVIDSNLAKDIFSTKDPLGEKIIYDGTSSVVVGVSKADNSALMGGSAEQRTVYLPLTSFQQLTGTREIAEIQGQATTKEDVDIAIEKLKKFLAKRNQANEDAYNAVSLEQQMAVANQMTGVLTLIISIIAGISLFVGGIGVMNIMLVSVTERTREIGIRKAIGAKHKDIMLQFLIESVIICLIGGTIGMLLGVGIAFLVAALAKWPPLVSPSTILIAVAFSSLVGIFFGIYPANKAAKLDPIEALRYE